VLRAFRARRIRVEADAQTGTERCRQRSEPQRLAPSDIDARVARVNIVFVAVSTGAQPKRRQNQKSAGAAPTETTLSLSSSHQCDASAAYQMSPMTLYPASFGCNEPFM
jgi:hypothetical protein